ncbi:MAG: valine--tRNA ligase [Pseudomonadota bacterium]
MALDKNFDAGEAEAKWRVVWEEEGAFKAGANASRDETFCIMIPPPNVTGVLHMGHAFNNTLQDILTRWHRMRGFDTLWQPGTDHAGIATQMVVERQLAQAGNEGRREMGREKFLEKVWEWKAQSGGTIIEQLKRLGASCDYSREAFTMSGAPNAPEGNEGNFHDAVIRVFVEMYNKGLIYRGKRLVNWDPHFETAISDLEVENKEVAGHMWHFKYPLAGGETYTYVEKDADGNITLEELRDYISIATTRPETMLGDGAVAVSPKDERYAPIVGKLCQIPVGPKEHRRLIPIITDDYPDPDFGSGAVKITGAHDFNDYQVAKRGNIPMYSLMDTKGAMRSDGFDYEKSAEIAAKIALGDRTTDMIDQVNLVPNEYRGLDRFAAREKVVADITAEGNAVMVPNPRRMRGSEGEAEGSRVETDEPEFIPYVENKPIMQPFGDRSKVVIEPMLTDQWFVDTDKIVGPAIDAVRNGETQILPERDAKVYFHWLENIEPWCISRQLWWGHQIPVWYGPRKTRGCEADAYVDGKPMKMICAANIKDAQMKFSEYYGFEVRLSEIKSDASQSLSAADSYLEVNGEDYPPTGFTKEAIDRNGINVFRDPDVLDTWFSSGLWPIGTLGWPEETEALKKYFPTDVLITGFDIIFFWVARMMMMQLAVVDQKPFHTVYVHALVRDEKGKKMSKSLGNVLDPLELIEEYGADAVRFTLTAMAAMGRDLKLSTSRIAGYRNFGTKLWNATRFAEMNDAVGIDVSKEGSAQYTVNKWIIGEVGRTRIAVDSALEQYRFNDAANALYAFVWGTVCDWYVELCKPLLQGEDEAAKAETQKVLSWVIDQCLILMHPIMPFITEELWAKTAKQREKRLVHTDWPIYGAELIDADADREMNWVVNLIESIRSIRSEMGVPAGAKLPLMLLEMDDVAQGAFDRNQVMIERLARLDGVSAITEVPKGAVTIPVEGGQVCLPLADVIDVDAEKARLTKSIEKLDKEIMQTAGKLNNPKFVANAPEEVVSENREGLAAAEAERAKLWAALDRVQSL